MNLLAGRGEDACGLRRNGLPVWHSAREAESGGDWVFIREGRGSSIAMDDDSKDGD